MIINQIFSAINGMKRPFNTDVSLIFRNVIIEFSDKLSPEVFFMKRIDILVVSVQSFECRYDGKGLNTTLGTLVIPIQYPL